MISSRTIVTLALLAGVGALGWAGGAKFSRPAAATDPHGHAPQRPVAPAAAPDPHAGHDHGEAKDEHAGHGHGERPDPGVICAEHRMPEAEDVLCNPQLMTTLLPGEGVKMRLATPEAAARAGIVVAAAQPAGLAGGPAIPARVTYHRGRLAEVVALAGGTVRRVAMEPGDVVGKGALLAEVVSPGVAAARADYQAALGRLELAEANVRREQELVDKGVSARMELEQAQAELRAARAGVEQLREQLSAYGAGTASGGGASLSLRSPLAGTIVARSAAVGQTLAPETPLFVVADLSRMWLELQLSADQAAQAKVGAALEAEIDGFPGQRFPGRIIQVAAGLDERTRLLKAVAEIDNPETLLKDGMFGTARLLAVAVEAAQDGKGSLGDRFADDDHGHDPTVAVPAAAVQAIDGKTYVFVAHAEPDLFELRRVEAGPRRGTDVLIATGLKAGENVAASQGFALKSELLKSRLGASCADH